MAARGLGTRDLTIKIDGVERKFEVSSVTIDVDETDAAWLSFGDVQAGDEDAAVLTFTAVQDPNTADSLWNLVNDEAGTTVACVLSPKAGTIGPTNKAFSFNAVVTRPRGTFLGGEVDRDRTNRFTFECEWQIDGWFETVTAP